MIIPPTSASTARRMKSRTFRQAGYASRSASARRNHHLGSGTCSAPDCPCATKLIERNDGRKFVTTLQVNVEQRGVEFVPGTGKSPCTHRHRKPKATHRKVKGAGRGKCRTDQKNNAATRGRTGRQHPPHQQMGSVKLHRPAESRLCGG